VRFDPYLAFTVLAVMTALALFYWLGLQLAEMVQL